MTGTAWPAPAYARSFGVLCAGAVPGLLDHVEARGGRGSLLDVGTGTGTAALAAESRGHRAVGMDPDPTMVAFATRALGGQVLAGRLPNLPVRSGLFDSVVGNFVVNHVSRPRLAIGEMSRAARAGGVIGVTVWPDVVQPHGQLWTDVLTRSGVTPAGGGSRLPASEVFARTEEGLASLLGDAGLSAVETAVLAWEFEIDAGQFWEGPAAGIAAIGEVVVSQPRQVRERMRRAYDEVVSPHLRAGRLRFPVRALVATGLTGAGRRYAVAQDRG